MSENDTQLNPNASVNPTRRKPRVPKDGVLLFPSKALMERLSVGIKQINLNYRVAIKPEVALQRLLESADDSTIKAVIAAVEADVQAWKEAQKQAADMASQLFQKSSEE